MFTLISRPWKHKSRGASTFNHWHYSAECTSEEPNAQVRSRIQVKSRTLSRIQSEEIPQQDQCTQAPGPDNIPGRVLRDCAVELTDVFTDIFNISLSQAVVPTCFKATTIIPVPKKSSPSCFNDYRPVALTPIPMKCFERLVMQHIKSVLPPPPWTPSSLHIGPTARPMMPSPLPSTQPSHIWTKRLICQDAVHRLQFSIQHNHPSAAHSQIGPAGAQHLSVQLAVGLSDRKNLRQYGSALTHPAPSHWTQGPPKDVCWAPSSSLCWPTTAHRHTTLTFSLSLRMTRLWWVSLATEMRQTTGARWAAWPGGAGTTISLWMWRRQRRLLLTSGECTLSMLLWPSTVRHHLTVERASSTTFLGVHITEDLSWTNNTAALAKKAQQHLYFLRKLRRARAPTPIMCTFYRGTIESILTSCITVWYGACNASCRKSLQRIVRAAEKIVGVSLPSLQDIYSTRLTRKALSIAGDPTHPTHSFFSLLPSGRRLRGLQARTSRLKDSFIHQAVRKLNSLPSLPPLPSFTPRNTELWHYDPPPPPPPPPPPLPPPPLQAVTRTSHFVQHWTDLYLIQHCL